METLSGFGFGVVIGYLVGSLIYSFLGIIKKKYERFNN